MTRREFIERNSRQILGGFAADEEQITFNLINSWMGDAVAMAAKANYMDGIKIDNVGYVNNSFYSTFKGLTITQDEQFLYKWELPQIPVGIGSVDGISRIRFKDTSGNISYEGVLLSENQLGYARNMRPLPNKILCYPEGGYGYAITTLILSPYTAMVTMISGGDSGDLDSILNVPADYFSIIVEYLKTQLILERQQPVDAANDGQSAIRTT